MYSSQMSAYVGPFSGHVQFLFEKTSISNQGPYASLRAFWEQLEMWMWTFCFYHFASLTFSVSGIPESESSQVYSTEN